MSNPSIPAFTPMTPILAQPVQRTAAQHQQVVSTLAKETKGKATTAKNKKALAAAAAKFSDNKVEPAFVEVPLIVEKPLAIPKAKRAPHTVGARKADRTPRKPKKGSTTASRKQAEVAAYMNGKRQRTMRVAPMQMDASTALAAMQTLSKKDLAAMAKMVELLNPLSRPARLKMLAALQQVAAQ